MLRLRGEHAHPRMIYLDGSLQLVSPSFPHEFSKNGWGSSSSTIVVGLDIPCIPAGSTTFRRVGSEAGVEGDETYYLANAAAFAGKRDRPAHRPASRPGGRGGPLPRRADGRRGLSTTRGTGGLGLRRERASDPGASAERPLRRSESSVAFPFLKASEIFAWIHGRGDLRDRVDAGLRHWVRELSSLAAILRRRLVAQGSTDPTVASSEPRAIADVDHEQRARPARPTSASSSSRPSSTRATTGSTSTTRSSRCSTTTSSPRSPPWAGSPPATPLAVRHGVPAALQGLSLRAPEDLRDGHQQRPLLRLPAALQPDGSTRSS